MSDEGGSGASPLRHEDASTRPSRPLAHRIPYARQRAIRACQLCRTRRIKCDNRKPSCSSCEKVGAICIIADADDAALDIGSVKILERIDSLEALLKTVLPSTAAATETLPATAPKCHLRVTTEEVLSWTVFQGHYESRRDLKALLNDASSVTSVASPLSIDASFLSGDVEHGSPQRMLDNFLHSIHVKNPMLDESKIRQAVHHMSLEGPSWSAEGCLALLVCALGSIASSFDANPGSSQRQLVTVSDSYFNAAQKRLGTIIGSGGVLEAQCFFYSGVYLMSKLQPLKAWRLFCQALACCQDFTCADPSYQDQDRLTRVPSGVRSLPAEECVYCSCWKSELELRKLLRLPDYAFDDLSYPLLFPTPPESVQIQQATSWYFYLSEISLRRLEHRLRGEITDALRATESYGTAELERVTRAAEDLAEEWTNSLPVAMSLQTPQCDDDVLKFILRGHLLDLWEVIYWSWLDVLFNKPLRTPTVSFYATKAFQVAIDRIRINKPGFHHRHHGTWLMLQSCTRSALILLAAAYTSEAAVLLPQEWRDAVYETAELLRFWQHGAGDTADRLQILQELSAGIT